VISGDPETQRGVCLTESDHVLNGPSSPALEKVRSAGRAVLDEWVIETLTPQHVLSRERELIDIANRTAATGRPPACRASARQSGDTASHCVTDLRFSCLITASSARFSYPPLGLIRSRFGHTPSSRWV
jgi:hypothetical protein